MDVNHHIYHFYHYRFILSGNHLLLKDALHDSELDEAERSSDDIINLFHAKPLDEISALDLNASLENFQEVTIFNTKGKNYFKQQMKICHLYLLI